MSAGIWSLLMFLASSLHAAQSTAPVRISMVPGFEEIYLGMPRATFLAVRKKARPQGNIPVLSDRNPPPKTEITNYEERLKRHPYFSYVRYSFDLGNLEHLNFDFISRHMSEIKSRRREILKMALISWGLPDDMAAEKRIDRSLKHPEYWEAVLTWDRDWGRVKFKCPPNLGDDILDTSMVRYWMKLIPWFGIDISIRIMDSERATHDKKKYPWAPERRSVTNLSQADPEIQQLFRDIELNSIIAEVRREQAAREKKP